MLESLSGQMLSQAQLADIITQAKSSGAIEANMVPLTKPLSFEVYSNWLEQDKHGEMNYLARHKEIKQKPQIKWPKAHSALVFLVPYKVSKKETPFKEARTALYSQENDYHEGLAEQFKPLLSDLAKAYPEEEFQFCTDSQPIMERDLAYKAGLGWFGKNSCLIHPQHGSLFFIAEILTSLKVESKTQQVHDFCGKCNRCIIACPTDAIDEKSKTLDAKLCISYWTIENKAPPPTKLAAKFDDWLFGCDICQTVCPWNEKSQDKNLMIELSQKQLPHTDTLIQELKWILEATPEEFKEAFHLSPILRSKHRGIKRNALIVIANKKLTELKAEVEKQAKDSYLESLAHWTLCQLAP